MKKRIFCMLLSLSLVISIVGYIAPSVAAANTKGQDSAQGLYELGLFRGTGTNSDGTPIFDLDKAPTRNQAIIMLVRLLGKEEEALSGEWELPFQDVSKGSTAYPYIGYAYDKKLTYGITQTRFGGTNTISAPQYITFVLRALGYADFTVKEAPALSDDIGITAGEYSVDTKSFSRGDVAIISYNALSVMMADGSQTLAEKLGVVLSGEDNQEAEATSPANEEKKPEEGKILQPVYFDTKYGKRNSVRVSRLVLDSGDVCSMAGDIELHMYMAENGGTDIYVERASIDDLLNFATGNLATIPGITGTVFTNGYKDSYYDEDGARVTIYFSFTEKKWTEYIDKTTAYDYAEYKMNGRTFTAKEPHYSEKQMPVDDAVKYVSGIRVIKGGTLYHMQDLLDYFGINKTAYVTYDSAVMDDWYNVTATLGIK